LSATRRGLIASSASALAVGALTTAAPVSAMQYDRDLIDLLFAQEQAQIALYTAILASFDQTAFTGTGFTATTRSGIEDILAAEQTHLTVVTRPDGPQLPPPAPPTLSSLRDALADAAALENLVVASYAFVIANIARPRLIRDLLGIHSVEARQATWLALLLGNEPFPDAIDPPVTLDQSTGQLIEPPRDPGLAATPVASSAMDPILAAIAREIGVSADDLNVVSATPQTWPDSALGCPQPGMLYAQVITPGFQIVVDSGGEQIEFHSDEQGNVVRCP